MLGQAYHTEKVPVNEKKKENLQINFGVYRNVTQRNIMRHQPLLRINLKEAWGSVFPKKRGILVMLHGFDFIPF
jgi:hypothetical protein